MDGYVINDYYNVNSSHGMIHDFHRLITQVHHCSLRVIIELVINYTADHQHTYFQRARRAKPDSVARNCYVWSDTVHRYEGMRIIFHDTETSNWAWDPGAKAYYWHRPRVFHKVTKVMRFWLHMGVDGLRLDATSYLCEREGTSNENMPETHAVVKRLHAWLDANFLNRVLLTRPTSGRRTCVPNSGDGDECHMAFHFP